MPTYVYRCESCGHRFDAWQHMTDEPLTACPQCEGPVHRLIFANGVVFRGGGFYSTDNRPTKAATDNGASDDGAKTDTKTDTKTETKTESTPAPAAEAPKAATPATKIKE